MENGPIKTIGPIPTNLKNPNIFSFFPSISRHLPPPLKRWCPIKWICNLEEEANHKWIHESEEKKINCSGNGRLKSQFPYRRR